MKQTWDMQKKYVPIAFLFAVLLILFAHFGAKMTAIPAFTYAEEEKRIYLTFDDGPSTKVTGSILDTLKKENVKATFFIVSDRVEGREQTLKRIAEEGHTLGVHSKSHIYKEVYASDSALLRDAAACADVIRNLTGVEPHVYRFPGGGHDRQKALLERQGYKVVGWNAVCGDEEIPHADAQTLVRTAIETAKGKNEIVLLLHDSAYRTETAKALPDIIAHFRAQGFAFCAF